MSKNYSGKLDIDVSGFNKALKEAKANLALAASEFRLAKEQGSAFESISDKLSRRLEALNKVYEQSNSKTELLKKAYELLKNELGETDKKVIDAKKVWIDSKTETERLSNEIGRYNKALEENKELTDNCAMCNENLCHALTWLEQVVVDVGEELAEKATKAIIDFTKETVNTGLQFETAFAGVKKVVDGTSEDFAKLQSEIRKTATEKPISADTLASLYQAGAQLGIDKDNLKDFTNAIIDLQNTSDLTAEAGATMLAQYANVMHLPSEDYERFASTLSYLGSTTATTESRIMAMAQRMSGAGSSIGMTHQGLLALATAMGSVGIEAEMGGSAISTIMLNIESAVAKSNNKLLVWAETAGMTADEFSKLWKTDVTGAMQAVLKGLSDEKAGGESLILTLEELGIKNIRQRQTMLQLSSASDMLTDTINKANQEWENNTFLTESSNEVYKTTANQMELLKNSFKEVQLSIYDDLAKPLQDVTKELTEFLKSDDVKKFSQDFATEITRIGKLATSLIKFVISNFSTITKAVKTAIPLFAHLFVVSTVNKYKDSFNNLLGGFKNFIPAIQKAILGQQSLNVAMSANPIGAVITAISLLVNGYFMLSAVMGDTTTAYEKQTQKVIDETKALENERQALIDRESAVQDEIKGIETEYGEYEKLIQELKAITDENGNVKEGYENRINEIIPKLQNATGQEITLIGNQIQGYKDLMLTLDQVIAKKKAEAKLSVYEDEYRDAVKNRAKDVAELKDIADKKEEVENQLKNTPKQVVNAKGDKLVDNPKFVALENRLKEYDKQIDILGDKQVKYQHAIDDYNNALSEYTIKYENPEKGQGSQGGKGSTDTAKEKTESELLKEGNYTYAELNGLNEKYKNDLKVYAEEMKKGNSAVTVAMVEATKKNLDIVQNKLKDMKEILGTTTTNVFSTENDTTEEQLEGKKKILKDTLSKLGTEMKNGNTAITQEMLDQVNKAIDQTDAKLQAMKNKYQDLDDEENEISEEIYTGGDEAEAHATGGVIYGKGVLDKDAIYDNAAKQAQMEATAYREAELQLQEEQLLANANQDALNKQIATLDPSNLDIYDTTNRLLAEQEQISHAQGLNDNAYRVSDAEVSTLNQAKQMAMTIDFTSIGLYICQGIVQGINANKYMVIDAVRAMMAEANEAAEDEEEEASPSKVFKRIGRYMDEGLEIGIKDNADGPINNLRDMMANINNIAAGKLSGLGENVSNTIKSANSTINGYNGENGVNKSQVNYTFNQYNTSPKALDVLSIYKESKSLLKREIRSQYV